MLGLEEATYGDINQMLRVLVAHGANDQCGGPCYRRSTTYGRLLCLRVITRGRGLVRKNRAPGAVRGPLGILRTYEEYQQLIHTGQFAAVPSSLEGKFFAESAADAAQWRERLEGAGNYRIVEADLSRSVAENLLRWEKLDGIGPARYSELHPFRDTVVRLWQ